MECHLHQVGEMSDQLHDVHTALGLVHQELEVCEVVTVGGPREKFLDGVLVSITQQVLLVPDVILSRHSQTLQLTKVQSGEWLICEQVCGQL